MEWKKIIMDKASERKIYDFNDAINSNWIKHVRDGAARQADLAALDQADEILRKQKILRGKEGNNK